MARRRAASVLLALLAFAGSAAAQLNPNNFIADGDYCRSAGSSAGYDAARRACEAARSRCSGALSAGSPGGIGAVSLPQCSSIAKGACQQAADKWRAPCGGEMRSGYGRCSAADFASAYDSAADAECFYSAQGITGVNPGTNSWSGAPIGVPAVVSPGSIVGAGVGATIGNRVAGPVGAVVGGVIGTGIGNSVDRAAINAITGRRLSEAAGVPSEAGAAELAPSSDGRRLQQFTPLTPGTLVGAGVGASVGNEVAGPVGAVVGGVVGANAGYTVDRTAVNIAASFLGRRMLSDKPAAKQA
ncbi:hypothetical protein Rsub_02540 [Raphidocelis subcapitata]|uniref:Glycine zipper domain-containing protein n=1 Tax=Raphidocelis subcapitata TaxID=307507 RepID=A0A2V0NQC0_9CHLO|nr:hypothetical protein Rsub_02540 [Raphidocelis subcapitata]|eukprot:GBF89836.1 hypothetical protein Rsub_02540 [Raphidocelis subcapitata]